MTSLVSLTTRADEQQSEVLLYKAKISRDEAAKIGNYLFTNWDSLTADQRKQFRAKEVEKVNEATNFTTRAANFIMTGNDDCQ